MPKSQTLEMNVHISFIPLYPASVYREISGQGWSLSVCLELPHLKWTNKIQMISSPPETIIRLTVSSFHLCVIVHFLWFSGRVNRMKRKTVSSDVLIAVTLTLWQHIETNEWDYFTKKINNSLHRCHWVVQNGKTGGWENQTWVKSWL